MKGLKAMLLVGFLLAGVTAYASDKATSYRCFMYTHDGQLSEAYYGFTVFGQICSKPHAYFGKMSNMKVLDLLSCIVVISTGADLEIRFNDVVDEDSGVSSTTITMSKQMLVARSYDMRGWFKCEIAP